MDDVDFDPYASKRVDQERPAGPFGVREVVPDKITSWKNRIHPESKKAQKLIDFEWQRVGAERIIISFETYVHDWTLKTVKKREALDKTDNRDQAQSLFAIDRNGDYLTDGTALRVLRVAPAPTATPNQIALAGAATRAAQASAITALVADVNSVIVASDRPVLMSYCNLTPGEFIIFQIYLDVFDRARSHFFLTSLKKKWLDF
jgi:hypothetical protein